jgi:hypothetical protein
MFAGKILWLALFCFASWGLYNVVQTTAGGVEGLKAVRDDQLATTPQQERPESAHERQTQRTKLGNGLPLMSPRQRDVFNLIPEILVMETLQGYTDGFTAIESICIKFTNIIRLHILVRGNALSRSTDFVSFANERSSSKLMVASADAHRSRGAHTLFAHYASGGMSSMPETLKQAEQDCAEVVSHASASVLETVAAVVIVHPYDQHQEVFDHIANNKAEYPYLWQLSEVGQLIFVWHRQSVVSTFADVNRVLEDQSASITEL